MILQIIAIMMISLIMINIIIQFSLSAFPSIRGKAVTIIHELITIFDIKRSNALKWNVKATKAIVKIPFKLTLFR